MNTSGGPHSQAFCCTPSSTVGGSRRSAGGAPHTALLVGVAHQAEGGEPLVALVVEGAHLIHGLLNRVADVEPESEGHILSQVQLPSGLCGGLLVSAEELLDDPLAGKGGHALDALPGDEVDGSPASDRLPDLHRQVQGTGYQRYVLQRIPAVWDIRRDLVVLTVVAE